MNTGKGVNKAKIMKIKLLVSIATEIDWNKSIT